MAGGEFLMEDPTNSVSGMISIRLNSLLFVIFSGKFLFMFFIVHHLICLFWLDTLLGVMNVEMLKCKQVISQTLQIKAIFFLFSFRFIL